jgi:hypothetical protein
MNAMQTPERSEERERERAETSNLDEWKRKKVAVQTDGKRWRMQHLECHAAGRAKGYSKMEHYWQSARNQIS